MILLGGCDTWGYQPQPFPVWTPIPSRTPGVVSATPLILPAAYTNTPTITYTPEATLITPLTPSFTPTGTSSPTPTTTPTPVPQAIVEIEILGCNTSLDITHGMGEVTNAYVIVKNTGALDLPNTCALLRAVDEDRVHPDKQGCVDDLPVQTQVTFKLTVDSTYKQDTVIQIDVSSADSLLLRADRESCRDIGLFGGAPTDVGVIKPIGQ